MLKTCDKEGIFEAAGGEKKHTLYREKKKYKDSCRFLTGNTTSEKTVEQNSLSPERKQNCQFKSYTQGKYLQQDVLLHGDYCLPNVILDNWQFSGFVDVDSGGVGDRHIDLFWGIWSLGFNLKTQAYRDRFLDAYGRDRVDTEMLRVVAAAEVFG